MYGKHGYTSDGKTAVDVKEDREKSKERGMAINDFVGGSFLSKNCRCGYPFCVGDISRRYIRNDLNETDTYLIYVSKLQAYLHLSRIAKANYNYIVGLKDRDKDVLEDAFRKAVVSKAFPSQVDADIVSPLMTLLTEIFNIGNQEGGAMVNETE